jgi:quercetin dioxygenase-like cupin family protein
MSGNTITMRGNSLMRKCVVVGLAAMLGFGPAGIGLAQQPKKAGQHFSFTGKRPTFHETNIENIEVVVSAADSEGRMSLIESYWLPAFAVQPHYHKAHVETFYIISGKVEWTIGGETHVMGAGDAVHIPPNTVHSVKVLEKMHSLMIYQNGGYEELAEAEAALTPEQRKDPKIQALLDKMADINRVQGTVASPPPAAGQPRKGVPVFSFHGKRAGFQEAKVENVEVALASAQSEGRLSLVESDWLPGFSVPAHYHKSHAETFYVLSGKVEWTVGGETRVLGAHDAVHIPPNTLHSVKVLEKIHTLWLSEPGGFDETSTISASYTAEEKKDPKVSRRLQQQSDFHVPGAQ